MKIFYDLLRITHIKNVMRYLFPARAGLSGRGLRGGVVLWYSPAHPDAVAGFLACFGVYLASPPARGDTKCGVYDERNKKKLPVTVL